MSALLVHVTWLSRQKSKIDQITVRAKTIESNWLTYRFMELKIVLERLLICMRNNTCRSVRTSVSRRRFKLTNVICSFSP